MLDRLTSMAVFVKAADLGSFTAAGTALGMTSQMVGKHVAAMEAQVGVPLIQRTTRRQSLTDTGQRFYDQCRIILQEVAAFDGLLEGPGDAPRGQLRISAPVGFGATALAPVVTDFLEHHPSVAVELNLTDRYVDLIDEGYDAVFRLGPLDQSTLQARELAVHDQVACAAPAYLKRHGTPVTPADLADHACLGFVNASGRHYDEWRFGRHGTILPVQVQPRFRVNDGRVLVTAAVAGHGIILQPRAVVKDALARGELVPVLTDYVAPSRSMYLMFPPREPQSPKMRAFVTLVTSAFRQEHPGEAPTTGAQTT